MSVNKELTRSQAEAKAKEALRSMLGSSIEDLDDYELQELLEAICPNEYGWGYQIVKGDEYDEI